jgi:hypothetical protein
LTFPLLDFNGLVEIGKCAGGILLADISVISENDEECLQATAALSAMMAAVVCITLLSSMSPEDDDIMDLESAHKTQLYGAQYWEISNVVVCPV